MNVPELRFPEFSGEWEEKKINELFEFLPTNSFSRANLNYEIGKVKNIHYGDIHTKFPSNLDCERFEIPFINSDIELNKIKVESYCKNGDLVIADASEDYNDIGKAIELKNVNNNQLLAGLHTFLARDKSGLTIDGYRGYMLLNEDIKLQIKKIATGISVLGISKTNLGELKVRIPLIAEQEKIASFLSKVDEKIEKLNKKQKLWETYKKGMMQKIFSRELRFKDENMEDYPNWKKISLDNILSERKIYHEKGNDYPHVTLSKNGISIKNESYNRDFLVKVQNKQYKITKLNDICYNPANLKFGVICINKFGSAIFSPIYVTFEVKKGFDNDFISYYLIRKDFIGKIRKFEEGTVYERMAVKPSDFIKAEIKVPNIEEQKMISAHLLLIENKISKLKEEFEIIEEFKKGLLQQMFC